MSQTENADKQLSAGSSSRNVSITGAITVTTELTAVIT